MLKLENVNAGYGKLDVLWDINCQVEKGPRGFVCLVKEQALAGINTYSININQ